MNNNFYILFIIIIFTIYYYKYNNKQNILKKNFIAIAHFDNKIKGNIIFSSYNNLTKIKINLCNLPKNSLLGFHIHEAGDLSDKCLSTCSHFNPFNHVHCGPGSKHRHVGDLGNIKTDKNGKCNMEFTDHMIKLHDNDQTLLEYLFNSYKSCNIIGRSYYITTFILY